MLRIQSLLHLLILAAFDAAQVIDGNGKNCSCGFSDTTTGEIYTESLIVYFNETDTLPDSFLVGDYEHSYEKDWNAIYRQAADPENVRINDTDVLQLLVSPPTSDHVVKGAEIRTTRRDIQYGSFRASLKPSMRNTSGSALSMLWQYNQTENVELDVMSTDNPAEAWAGTFIRDEFTTRELGVNFTTALAQANANQDYTVLSGGLANGSLDLWDFSEYRIDWTADDINFYIGGNLSRSLRHAETKGMPSVPAPISFKHWSTGNRFSMQGPPRNISVAHIAWIRMFFNSSSITTEERDDNLQQCSRTEACSVDDYTLRGATTYSELATRKWSQAKGLNIRRMPALWVSVVCISISSILLLHALIRRAPWRKTAPHYLPENLSRESIGAIESVSSQDDGPSGSADCTFGIDSDPATAASTRAPSSTFDFKVYGDDLAIETSGPYPNVSVYSTSFNGGSSSSGSLRFDSRATTPGVLSPYSSNLNITVEDLSSNIKNVRSKNALPRHDSDQTLVAPSPPGRSNKIRMETVTESVLLAPRMRSQPPPVHERIDYLAGLVALCAILVTVMHFGLTFVPAMVIPSAPLHHRSEYWVQQLVSPFILNQMWLGVFFTTSVRFLVAGYLKRGELQDIARAAVRRTPRLMIPVAAIALLEYFVIDVGATTYLRYIPSITWSTWPYVTRFETIGHFISEVLELVFLIPNAVPHITFNYCTGVLWTIAVQLQGSWLVLTAVIVVREMKTPWKRTCYYIFAIFTHWYAESWGSYLWFGLLLTDLDVTYKYKIWLHKRPLAYYPLIISCWLCVAAGFAANLSVNWTRFNFPAIENSLHPDPSTGEPLWNTPDAGYPAYYVPRLNGLLFAAGMQAIVELSPAVQWFLSLPFLLVLFPHIFTIYLIHGMIFWTWGSWLMVFLADRHFSYSVNAAIVGVTSYTLLFLCLPIVTPVIEALGKDLTALVWMSATEKSPPKRRTLFPFPEDLLIRRKKGSVEAVDSTHGGSTVGSGSSSPSEKGGMKTKMQVEEISQLNSGRNN